MKIVQPPGSFAQKPAEITAFFDLPADRLGGGGVWGFESGDTYLIQFELSDVSPDLLIPP